MKVNMVTAKPADGGPVRCLLISEQADGVIDFFATLREAKGVHPETGEQFTQIALFQRPTTTKRSTFHEEEPAPKESGSKVPAPSKPKAEKAAKDSASKPVPPPSNNAGGEEESKI